MSSHHFVKEGQEPALFIINPVSPELIGSLLEWAPLVMVLDTILEDVLAWGVKIDVVLANEDRLADTNKKISGQFPVKVVVYQHTDEPLVVGLQTLISLKQRAVNILSISENTFGTVQNFYPSILQVSLIDTLMKWSFLPAGKYEKWLPAQSTIVIRKTVLDQDVSIPGLKIIDTPEGYEVVHDTQVNLTSANPFWVGEFLR